MNAEDVRKVAVIGAGIMGHGIAQSLATAGYEVTVTDTNAAALESVPARVERNLAAFIDAGLIAAADVPVILGRIHTAPSLEEAAAGADVVIEAATENQDLKRQLFNRLDAACPERTILTSNSSSLLISEFASETKRQDRCILTHWMNPPHIVPAVEVIPGPFTSQETIEVVTRMLRRAGKLPVRLQKEIPGYLVNRIQMAMFREVWSLWSKGVASAEDLDMAVRGSFGFRLPSVGPLLANDLAGDETTYVIARRLLPIIDSSPEPSTAFREMVEKGDFGLKTGRGFYDHTPQEWQAIVDKRDRDLLRQLKCSRE
ncbi:MAG: 3-hydroxyacyl-CoA dehydrogenase family protein [Dehalococcoidia bacterium]|jgi:3-hydroxybutyryl-CoA dehydrogenase|nr:3-hydroxyacyl-CoA dehydrogenase family protein [Dehalococcoidia bacterium]